MKQTPEKRNEMFYYIRDCIKKGLPRDDIIDLLRVRYNKTYKVGTWKYLRKMAIYGMNIQENQVAYNEYMKKCHDELNESTQEEDTTNSVYAEELFDLSKGIIKENE